MASLSATQRYRPIAIALASLLPLAPAAEAQVAVNTTCGALTLYGWGVEGGTCSALNNPGVGGAQWVCEISTGNPEIHTTFNAATPLHLTVVSGGACPNPPDPDRGHIYLQGNFPAAVAFVPPVPATLCGVNIAGYLARLNGIQQGATPAGQTACRAGFLAAPPGRLAPAIQAAYLAKCAQSAVPAGPCP